MFIMYIIGNIISYNINICIIVQGFSYWWKSLPRYSKIFLFSSLGYTPFIKRSFYFFNIDNS